MVRLTGADLRRLASFLGVQGSELRRRGLVNLVREPWSDGRFLWRPRIRFRTKPLIQCPFLVNDVDARGRYRGLCSLHPQFKPLVCRLAPLTREVSDDGSVAREAWSFLAPVEGCPGVGRGPVLPVERPPLWDDLLDDEVRWMRWLVSHTGGCPDAEAAWNLLEEWMEDR